MFHKKVLIWIFLIVWFFWWSLFAQSWVPWEQDPNTEITTFWAWDTPFNPTDCASVFWDLLDSVDADVKDVSWKCCYISSQSNNLSSLWWTEVSSWKINWSTATYTPFQSSLDFSQPLQPISIGICPKQNDEVQKDEDIQTIVFSGSCRFYNPDIKDQSLLPSDLVFWDCKTNSCGTGAQYIEKRVSTDQWDVVMCEKCDMDKCNCWVKLNTNVPFIGRCIMYENTNDIWANWDETTTVNPLNAFPVLMWALVKILMSVIMVICFASLIIWWFMMTVPDQYDTWKWIIKKVIWTIVWLWSLWTILYLVNPNFFS